MQEINAANAGTITIKDLTVNRLGFGAMRITGEGIWGPPKDKAECLNVLKKAIELGVNFIDTADSYGPDVSEQLISEALYPYPHDLVIATKGGHLRTGPDKWVINGDPKRLKEVLDKSLKNLKLECIDLYQLHRVDPQIPLEETLGALKEAQQQGKIKHIGLSEVSVDQIRQAQKMVDIVSVQNKYSVMERMHEDVLTYCEENNIVFIPWYPLGAGRLTKPSPKIKEVMEKHSATPTQLAIAWLLHRSKSILPIPGTGKTAHLEENIAAASIELTAEDIQILEGGIPSHH